mgnify:FL=1
MDSDLLLYQGIGDATGKIALAGSHASPKEIADVLHLHDIPMLNVEEGVLHLLTPTVVVGKCPLLHGRASKAMAFQICHGLTVTAGLLRRCLPVDALMITAAGMGQQATHQRRCLHAELLGSAALATVQKAVLTNVILRPWRDLG